MSPLSGLNRDLCVDRKQFPVSHMSDALGMLCCVYSLLLFVRNMDGVLLILIPSEIWPSKQLLPYMFVTFIVNVTSLLFAYYECYKRIRQQDK